MAKIFYEWEDTTDPHALGRPELGVRPEFRLRTKAAVRKDWREYVEAFASLKRTPKIRVWRISYDEVKV